MPYGLLCPLRLLDPETAADGLHDENMTSNLG